MPDMRVQVWCEECGWQGCLSQAYRLEIAGEEADIEFFGSKLPPDSPERPLCCPTCGTMLEDQGE